MTIPITASFVGGKGLDSQTVIPIYKESVIAGNSDAVDLKLSNRFMSRRHFQVHFETDVFYLSDLGSTNGTFVNDIRLESRQRLNSNDMVRVGWNEFRFVDEEENSLEKTAYILD